MSALALIIIPLGMAMIVLVVLYVFYVAGVTNDVAREDKPQVAFYDQCDFQGQRVNHAVETVINIDALGFDHGDIRSIQAPRGQSVTLYAKKDLHGRHKTYKGSVRCLNKFWKGSLESVLTHKHGKVHRRKACHHNDSDSSESSDSSNSSDSDDGHHKPKKAHHKHDPHAPTTSRVAPSSVAPAAASPPHTHMRDR